MPIVAVPGLKFPVNTETITHRRVLAEHLRFTHPTHALLTNLYAYKPAINEESVVSEETSPNSSLSRFQAAQCVVCWDLYEKCLQKIHSRDPNYWYFSYESKQDKYIEIVRMVDEIHDSAAAGCRFCSVLSQIVSQVPVSEEIFQICILLRTGNKVELQYGGHRLILYAPEG
jgi:hypothetical protein